MMEGEPDLHTWEQWQSAIVTLLQRDFRGEALRHVSLEDIDWPSWRGFYLQGKSPRAAIERALDEIYRHQSRRVPWCLIGDAEAPGSTRSA